ncbi:MAG: hypothetical protein AVW06_02810 [Hadesarchaea archaeon DG-33-1]|nr:MAG: hypothetical protein AVW06_02810 [Hadesarchaea archaeon DG-33-1]
MATCDVCGEEIALPYKCSYCRGTFCSKHRLPENHPCRGLKDVSIKARNEGRIYTGVDEGPEEEEAKFERGHQAEFPSPFGGPFGLVKALFFRRASVIILLVMVLFYFGQLIAQEVLGSGYYELGNHNTFLYYLGSSRATVFIRPWTLITSIFAHGSFSHLFLNGIVLFFLGPVLEMRIGRKKFVSLFLGAGIIAGMAQLFAMSPEIVILGASGAIFGVLGTLTVLSPRMPILLFFFIPMELWMVTLGYGLLEAILAFSGSGGPIGHVAHFTGLVVGLAYGYKLRGGRRYVHPLQRPVGRYHW